MLNHFSPLYLQRGMKKAFIESPRIGPTANTNPIESRYMLYLQELLQAQCVSLQQSPSLIMPSN